MHRADVCSRRLWIDSLLAGLVSLAVATVLLADGKRCRTVLAIGGAFLGLGALAKLTALVLVPVVLVAAIRRDATSGADRLTAQRSKARMRER